MKENIAAVFGQKQVIHTLYCSGGKCIVVLMGVRGGVCALRGIYTLLEILLDRHLELRTLNITISRYICDSDYG